MGTNEVGHMPPDRRPGRVLIAQTTYAGDLLLALPLVIRLGESLPGIAIDMLVSSGLAPLAAACPAVRRVHVIRKDGGHPTLRSLIGLSRDLRSESYDCAITLPGSLRTALAMVLAGIPWRIGWDPGNLLTAQMRAVKYPDATRQLSSARGTLAFERLYRGLAPVRGLLPDLYTEVLTPRVGTHRAVESLEALRSFGVQAGDVPRSPWLRVPEEIQKEVDHYVPGSTGGWVVIAPGATQPTRRWPVEYMGEVARQLATEGHQVLVIGTGRERAAAERICAGALSAHVRSLAGRTSVLVACEIIRRASVIVANDSAAVHMASAMGTPVVALFGPTRSSSGFAPLAPGSIVLERDGLVCRPCTVYGSPACPVGTHECLRSIPPHDVLGAIRKIVRATSGPPNNGREASV